MTALDWFFVFTAGSITWQLGAISGHLRAIRERLAPAEPGPAPEKAAPSAPRPGNHSYATATGTGEHAGHSFTLHGDGVVVAPLGEGVATWRSETEFRAWAERHPAPIDIPA